MRIMDQYNKSEIEEIVARNYSYNSCLKEMGYSGISGDTIKALKSKLQDLNISTEHFTTGGMKSEEQGIKQKIQNPYTELFVKDSSYIQSTLRRYYIKLFPPQECAICHLPLIWNNKPLTLILDHINGNNRDDRLENLRWVCPNCNSQLDTTGSRNIHRHANTCIDCGKIITKGALRCRDCQILWRNNPLNPDRKNDYPSRELLKELIYTKTFNEIGRQYDVDGNTIRQWCRKLNLPSRKYEIEKHSKEEWEQL